MRTWIIGLAAALTSLGLVQQTRAQASCSTAADCVERLTERRDSDRENTEGLRDRVVTLDGVQVASAFAGVFAHREYGLQPTDRWNIATLPDETWLTLALQLLKKDADVAALRAGDVLHREDRDTLLDRLSALPSGQAGRIRARIQRLAKQRDQRGPANLALLLDGSDRIDALAHHVGGNVSKDAPMAVRYLDSLDPVRLDTIIVKTLNESPKPGSTLKRLAMTNWPRSVNYAWLGRIWNDDRLPPSARDQALSLVLDRKNDAPVPWSLELGSAIADSKLSPYEWHDILALYGNDALDLLLTRFAEEGADTERLISAIASTEGLDPARISPAVTRGLAVRDNYGVTTAAVAAWKVHRLQALDQQARDAVRENPFDIVQYAFENDITDNPNGLHPVKIRHRTSDMRDASDYCETGSRLPLDAEARNNAQALGIPDRRDAPYDISTGATKAAVRLGEAWYVGYDRGEFGGGLMRVDENEVRERVLDENVQFIVPVHHDDSGDAHWVMAGLNHMFPRGSLHRLDGDGVTAVMRLPSAVQALARDGDDYILSFHDTKREPERWTLYQTPLRLSPNGSLRPACPRGR